MANYHCPDCDKNIDLDVDVEHSHKSLMDLSLEALSQLPLNPNFARDLVRIDQIIGDITTKQKSPRPKVVIKQGTNQCKTTSHR